MLVNHSTVIEERNHHIFSHQPNNFGLLLASEMVMFSKLVCVRDHNSKSAVITSTDGINVGLAILATRCWTSWHSSTRYSSFSALSVLAPILRRYILFKWSCRMVNILLYDIRNINWKLPFHPLNSGSSCVIYHWLWSLSAQTALLCDWNMTLLKLLHLYCMPVAAFRILSWWISADRHRILKLYTAHHKLAPFSIGDCWTMQRQFNRQLLWTHNMGACMKIFRVKVESCQEE